MRDQYRSQVNYISNLSNDKISILILSKMLDHLNKIKLLTSKNDIEKRSNQVDKAIKIIMFLSNSVNNEYNNEESEIILNFYFVLMTMMFEFVKTKDVEIIDRLIKIIASFKEAWEYRANDGNAPENEVVNDQEPNNGFKLSL
ncbi:MAG: flagellar protein FliS [Alphaproteobacteria bacterium]|nr:flagellar protein FliS [Alphaproteobacteria bacterium]OJV47064.1 MAG: hypothetical protein BGO28_01285 [Alphaproteobacteria bacterium 43-37]